ncbi:MAG: hypothetical protein LBS11_09195 [Oscillospiraceae bacterium]|nr:hypothetical protein [Oscillospiraceae bacterium]
MARRFYSIAGLTVSIDGLAGVGPLPSFEPFALADGLGLGAGPDLAITLRAYDPSSSPVPPEEAMDLVSEDMVNRLYMWDGQLVKRTAMREGDPRCMWTLMPPNDYTRAEVFIPGDWLDYENYGNAFLFEKMLLSHGVIMLHCSLVADDRAGHGGIAFTAPSQTGKSTQANLWRDLRGARIVNGDRAIIRALPDGIYAYGSPWAGSSEIYENERVRLAALVALAQAPVNTVRPLTHAEGLRYILAGTSLPLWDDRLFDLGMAAVERLITEVPMPLLSCTPDARAVEALEEHLGWKQD